MEPSALVAAIPQTVPIAWAGECELLSAKWELDVGRTVELRIVEQAGPDLVNPFKQYTKRQHGHVGQLFAAAIVAVGAERCTYDGDVMLAGWGDTSDRGQWVRFWLDEESDHHPFNGFSKRVSKSLGQFFMMTLVLLDTDGNPLDPKAMLAIEQAVTARRHRSLAQSVHLMVTGDLFLQYLREKSTWTARLKARGEEWTPERAKAYVKYYLGIESLADLDRMPEKAEKFHRLVREPFAKWAGES